MYVNVKRFGVTSTIRRSINTHEEAEKKKSINADDVNYEELRGERGYDARIAFSERAITRISRTGVGWRNVEGIEIAALMSLAERPPIESLVS